MKGGANEFMRDDFSLGEYLTRVLSESAGGCTRVKDTHVRMLSKQSELLAEEPLGKREDIEKALRMFGELAKECGRIERELHWCLPIETQR